LPRIRLCPLKRLLLLESRKGALLMCLEFCFFACQLSLELHIRRSSSLLPSEFSLLACEMLSLCLILLGSVFR
jgi:hypothetical protein